MALEGNALSTIDTLNPLSSLRKSFLSDLLHHVAQQTLFAGQSIFEKGTYDKQHIFLQVGEIELQYPSGEVFLLRAEENTDPIANVQPRPCRAIAKTDCTLLRVDSDRLDRTLSWSQIADYLLAELSTNRDLDEDIDWIQTVLNSNLFLKAPPVNAEQILNRLTPMVVYKGEVIVRQGEIGDCCYFIKEGDADVSVRQENDETMQVARIHPGRCFGEDALVYETVRNATVRMTSDGVLMRLEKSDFLLLLKEPMIDEVDNKDIGSLIDEPVFIDVRTESEYHNAHLAFSANIPLGLLALKRRLLSTGKTYIMYCDTGRRSKAAAFLLGKLGYSVMTLKDGYLGQKMEDLLVREDGYILRDGELALGQ